MSEEKWLLEEATKVRARRKVNIQLCRTSSLFTLVTLVTGLPSNCPSPSSGEWIYHYYMSTDFLQDYLLRETGTALNLFLMLIYLLNPYLLNSNSVLWMDSYSIWCKVFVEYKLGTAQELQEGKGGA